MPVELQVGQGLRGGEQVRVLLLEAGQPAECNQELEQARKHSQALICLRAKLSRGDHM